MMDDKTFSNFLKLDSLPATVEDRLCRVAQVFHEEAMEKVGIGAKRAENQRLLKEERAYIMTSLKERKAAGDKSLTEAACAALIEQDEKVQGFSDREIELEAAEVLRGYRLEALRMLHASALKLHDALGAERARLPQ